MALQTIFVEPVVQSRRNSRHLLRALLLYHHYQDSRHGRRRWHRGEQLTISLPHMVIGLFARLWRVSFGRAMAEATCHAQSRASRRHADARHAARSLPPKLPHSRKIQKFAAHREIEKLSPPAQAFDVHRWMPRKSAQALGMPQPRGAVAQD